MSSFNRFLPDPKPSPKAKKPYRLKKKPQKRVEYRGVLMPSHTAIYYEYFNLDPFDYIECECGCGQQAVDVNHLFCKGMGGSNMWDFIENLVAMARVCHVTKGDNKEYYDELITKHAAKMGVSPAAIHTKLNEVRNRVK